MEDYRYTIESQPVKTIGDLFYRYFYEVHHQHYMVTAGGSITRFGAWVHVWWAIWRSKHDSPFKMFTAKPYKRSGKKQ
jgi:hypothetical protein